MTSRKAIGIVILALPIVLVYFPLLSTKTQILGTNWSYQALNLFDSIMLFSKDKEYFLAAVIFIFTLILPILKYIELIRGFQRTEYQKPCAVWTNGIYLMYFSLPYRC